MSKQSSETDHSIETEVSDLKEPCSSASIHDVVTGLSPLRVSAKTNRRYFDGKISNDTSSKRFVSFNTKLFKTLKKARDDTSSINLQKCSVKRSNLNIDELEIIVTDKSNVTNSPKKFKIDSNVDVISSVNLADIHSICLNSNVTVSVKVTNVNAPTEVNSKFKKLTKQDCIVSDGTGACRLVLWEKNISQLKVMVSYTLSNIKVREYCGDRYLSMTIDSTINPIDDIGEVIELDPDELPRSNGGKLVEGEVITVIYESYRACPICNSKVQIVGHSDSTAVESNPITECTKCKGKSNYSNTQIYI